MYVDNIAIDVSPERLRRLFNKVNGSYQICKAVRNLCVFSKHDLAADPPFANIDLWLPQSVDLFRRDFAKSRAALFQYALRPRIAIARKLGDDRRVWQPVRNAHKEHRIYSKKLTAAKLLIDFPVEPSARHASGTRPSQFCPKLRSSTLYCARPNASLAVAPRVCRTCCIDEDSKILHFGGEIGPYLNPASGVASFDLKKMVRDSLIVELLDAIDTAKRGDAGPQGGLDLPNRPPLLDRGGRSRPAAGRSRRVDADFIVVFHGSSSSRLRNSRKMATISPGPKPPIRCGSSSAS